MNISDEAVEAAETALRSKVNQIRYGEEWDDWRARQARAAIEAAAPFIAAQAWDEGEHAGYMNRSAEERHGIEPHTNPYRSEQ